MGFWKQQRGSVCLSKDLVEPCHPPYSPTSSLSTAPSSRTPHLARTCACLACAYRVRARVVRTLVRTNAPRFSKNVERGRIYDEYDLDSIFVRKYCGYIKGRYFLVGENWVNLQDIILDNKVRSKPFVCCTVDIRDIKT